MKALVLENYKHFKYKNVPKPRIGPEDVLIRVMACGICGSDIHGMDGSTGRRQPPIIMGHEAAGVIAEVGPDVEEWREGERVTFDSTIFCGQCYFCRKGQINLCEKRRVFGCSTNKYHQDGAFADYVAVPQHILYRLPEGLSFDQAALIEPLTVALHAVRRTNVKLNDSVIVLGTGVIGLLLIQILRVVGCNPIIAIDLDQNKLDFAQKLGADIVVKANAHDTHDVIKEVKKHTDSRGADVAFEAVGIESTVKTALTSLRKGGSLSLIGNLSQSINLPLQEIVTREITMYGSCASSGEYPECLNILNRGVVKVEPLISITAPLAEGVKWFDYLYKNKPGIIKVILNP